MSQDRTGVYRQMPKRNIVWIIIGAVIFLLLLKVPENLVRRDALYNQFGPLLDVRVQVRKHYVEEVSDDKLLRSALDGMLNRLDRYSEYFDEDEYEQFDKKTKGRFPGIGILVDQAPGGGLLVVSPIEGNPAFRADVRAGDHIVKIDGQETRDLTLAQGVKLIEGPTGTDVCLTIYRPSTEELLDKTITREIVVVPTVRGWARFNGGQWDSIIDQDRHIGYLRISEFKEQTADEFDGIMQDLLAKHDMRGLILDVRDNPGGLLSVVIKIVDRFISEGKIVSTKGRLTPEQPYMATRESVYPAFPVVVLVNNGSASASEILAGALRDHGRATIVGEPTFGKGSVQELIEIENNNGAVKLTTAYYHLPNGQRIHGKGIMPDKIIDLTPEEREELIASQRAVYVVGHAEPRTLTTTQAATRTAPADDEEQSHRVEIVIDRQLQEGLDMIRAKMASRPASH